MTKSMIGWLAVAGPFYVVISLGQAMFRDGFDLRRHAWSQLAVGDFGWIQSANLVLTGVMIVVGTHGVRRALGGDSRSAIWAPRLLMGFGAGMFAAGIFTTDAGYGFPVGTPTGPPQMSWHGALHLVSAGLGFLCLTAACLFLGRWFSRRGESGWALTSRVVGITFLAAFAGLAAGAGAAAPTLAFVAVLIATFTWLTAVATHIYGDVEVVFADPARQETVS